MKNNWKTGIIGFCLGVLVVAGTAVFAVQMEVVENPFPIKLDGQEITLEGYNLNDNTYFKLRDIGEKVGFDVDFKDDTILMTSKTEAPDESGDTAKELADKLLAKYTETVNAQVTEKELTEEEAKTLIDDFKALLDGVLAEEAPAASASPVASASPAASAAPSTAVPSAAASAAASAVPSATAVASASPAA